MGCRDSNCTAVAPPRYPAKPKPARRTYASDPQAKIERVLTRAYEEDALDGIRQNHLSERFRTSHPVVAFSDVRDEFEHKVEATVSRFLSSLQIVTRADLERIEGEIDSLRKKTDNLARKEPRRELIDFE